MRLDTVSTLLEILGNPERMVVEFRRLTPVSTLLEILGLVCLIVVGF